MTAPNGSARTATTIKVDCLSRVEGEGSIYIKLKGDRVQDVKLKIFEPPRLFEPFLRGRSYLEVADITARICGICPIAYQMSAVHAIESAFGVTVHPMVRLLRRLFYCAEWMESHALHVYMLQAPDFLGYPDVIQMAAEHRAVVEGALRLKKAGNSLMTLLGGREIHPVTVTPGGFFRVPPRRELDAMAGELRWALDASLATVRLVSAWPFPDFEQDYEFVCLSHPDEYPMNEGRLVSNRGLDIDAFEYDDHFLEQQVKHSTSLHSVVRERGSYLVGPLARFNLNYDRLPAVARQAAEECQLTPPCRNPFRGILVRAVELVFACDEALRLIQEYEPPPQPKVNVMPRASVGMAITEAPRGILYHRYSFDLRGVVTSAKLIPPTSQNLKRMEDDLWHYVPQIVLETPEEIARRCEMAVRNYDPCISCSVHALRATVERSGAQ
jgi:sulfhydrogenase subunit alpha